VNAQATSVAIIKYIKEACQTQQTCVFFHRENLQTSSLVPGKWSKETVTRWRERMLSLSLRYCFPRSFFLYSWFSIYWSKWKNSHWLQGSNSL